MDRALALAGLTLSAMFPFAVPAANCPTTPCRNTAPPPAPPPPRPVAPQPRPVAAPPAARPTPGAPSAPTPQGQYQRPGQPQQQQYAQPRPGQPVQPLAQPQLQRPAPLQVQRQAQPQLAQPQLARPQQPQLQRPSAVQPSMAAHSSATPARQSIEHAAPGGNGRADAQFGKNTARPAAGQTAAGAQQHRVQLSGGATVAAVPGHAGFTAVKKDSARGSIVVEQRVNAQGHTRVDAYHQVVSADGHTTARVYTDGRRSIDGANFHSTGRVNGPQFVQYHNGLHAAYAPNGHALYTESFTNSKRATPMVKRTYYGFAAGGQVRSLARPVDRYYAVTRVRGYDTYVYQPMFYAAPMYALFYSGLAYPIVVGPRCLVCPSPGAVFEVAPTQYSDPMELLGDMQISAAVTDEGVAPVEGQAADPGAAADGAAPASDQPPPDQAPADQAPVQDAPPPPPELAAATASADATDLRALQQQAGDLQNQAAARVRDDPSLAAAGADQPPAATPSAPPAGADLPPDTLAVSEDVRTQIHKQVRLSLAQHAHDHPLTLIDIIQSGYSRIYLFQVAAAIDTVSAITGDGCALGSGDLIAFTSLGDSQRPTAQMKVVAARGGHCLSQDLVEVSVGDLQEMLNTFNQRLEENMRKLHACAAAKDGCVRT